MKRGMNEKIVKRLFRFLKKHPPQHCPFMEELVDRKFCTADDDEQCNSREYQKGCWQVLFEQALGDLPIGPYEHIED